MLQISPTSTFAFVDNTSTSDDEDDAYYALPLSSEAVTVSVASPTGLAPNPTSPSQNEHMLSETKEMEDDTSDIAEVPTPINKKHDLFFFEDGSETFIVCIH